MKGASDVAAAAVRIDEAITPPLLTVVAPPLALRLRLPRPLDALVGREEEVAAVHHLLLQPGVRLVTLTGPGGVGKTRLAIEAATRAAGDFDGVGFVALAAVRDPGIVLSTIVQSLLPREAGGQLPAERLRAFFGEHRVLLVLDNFEQVLGAAPDVARLLADNDALQVLVTSRAVLHLSGERVFPVSPLALPDAAAATPEGSLAAPAVRLFAMRAEAADPTFALTDASAATVAEICRRLDGLPLALELAAAQIRVLPPPALLTRLAARLPVLTGGPQDQPPRLRAMRDAIAWSYDLLSPEEQALFRRLSVFVGGCTLEAAEAVSRGVAAASRQASAPSPPPDTLALVGSLVDQSLLRRVDRGEGGPRFDMLETVREYAAEQLAMTGEAEDASRRHAAYVLGLAETARPALTGPEQPRWLAALDAEHNNLRAALRWAIESGQPAMACRLAAAVWRFWHARGLWSEGRAWLGQVLTAAGDCPDEVRAEALLGAGALAFPQGDGAQAVTSLEEALALFRALDDRRGIGDALTNLGIAAGHRGDHAAAAVFQEEALATFRQADIVDGVADALHNLGNVFYDLAQFDRAVALWEESLALERQMDRQHGLAGSLLNLGIGAHDRGDDVQSAKLLGEALTLLLALDLKDGIAWCLEGLARLAAPARAASATRLLGLADALVREIGAHAPSHRLATYDQVVATLRATLGEAAFAAAWAAGQRLTREELLAEVAAITAAVMGSPPFVRTRPAAHGLTGREMEILALVAGGLSNSEIGERLFISHTTVARHVANIFSKLGVDSRAKATTFAHRHGLV